MLLHRSDPGRAWSVGAARRACVRLPHRCADGLEQCHRHRAPHPPVALQTRRLAELVRDPEGQAASPVVRRPRRGVRRRPHLAPARSFSCGRCAWTILMFWKSGQRRSYDCGCRPPLRQWATSRTSTSGTRCRSTPAGACREIPRANCLAANCIAAFVLEGPRT